MAKDLVIVESPTKARTVGRFLGKNYTVLASMGHVRDLPSSKLGVEVDDGFKPTYVVPTDKKKVIKQLKAALKDASTVYLATDPDREGEAISWHLVEAADLGKQPLRRVVFHEITPAAIKEAFDNPRELDLDLVNAQQARRILDRLLGYQLSPLLWSKVGSGLSAGRVQSVALRLVVDRAREIRNFAPVEYWSIDATLAKRGAGQKQSVFKAALHSRKGERKKLTISNEADAAGIVGDLKGASYAVNDVRRRETRSRPAAPFTTSTLQQEAGRKLRFPVKKTMMVAQQLYEGVNAGAGGEVGLITYMRTDSTNLSETAVQETRQFVGKRYGKDYIPKSSRVYKTRAKGAQEAHEAIRPTSVDREPEAIRSNLTSDQYRLYDLIWKRMVACQMADALYDSTAADIEAPGRSGGVYVFRATGSVLKFPGYRAVYIEGRDAGQEEEAATPPLPVLEKDEPVDCRELKPGQHFTQPPAYYTEASLVKSLEELGIGRPSTYAPTISTIQDRNYVRKNGHLEPTQLGEIVTDLLVENFADLVNPGFTAQMEEDLDDVAEGKRGWGTILDQFYGPFQEALTAAQSIPRVSIPSDEKCDKCERPMEIRSGRYGRFLACTGYPECKSTRPYLVRVGVVCPRCGGDLVERRSRKTKSLFYGCANYPTCNLAVNQRPIPAPCPECEGLLIMAGRNRVRCSNCAYKAPLSEVQAPAEEEAAAVEA